MNSLKPALLTVAILIVPIMLEAKEEYGLDFIEKELQRAQSDPDGSTKLSIAAPADFVFEFLSTRSNEYVDGAVEVDFDHSASSQESELGRGSIRKITMDNGDYLIQRFLEADEPNGYAYFTDMESYT